MASRVILPVAALLILVALAITGAALAQTTSPPANPLPSPLVAGWQPAAGEVSYVVTTGDVLGSAPDMTLAMDLEAIHASITEAGLYTGRYRSDGTYKAPAIVSVGSGGTMRFFMYSSPTVRSSAHNPITAPQHWREIGRLASMQPDPGGTATRYAGGELIKVGSDIFLCLTAPPFAVTANQIRGRAEFVNLTAQGDPAYRGFVSGLGVSWNTGQLSRFGTGWFITRTAHTQTQAETVPAPAKFDQLLSFRRLTEPTYQSLTPKDSSTIYITNSASGTTRTYLGTILLASSP